jgi:hypothetical protein
MTDEPPQGVRYSQVYLAKGEPLADSERFRVRLAGYF